MLKRYCFICFCSHFFVSLTPNKKYKKYGAKKLETDTHVQGDTL